MVIKTVTILSYKLHSYSKPASRPPSILFSRETILADISMKGISYKAIITV